MALRMIGALGAGLLVLAGLPQTAAAQDAAPAPAAESCTIGTSETDQIRAMLDKFGATVPDWPDFCARLNAANMGVVTNGYTATELDTTTAVVLMRLYDLDSNVRSEEMNFGFQNIAELGDEVTEQTLSEAYNTALGGVAENLDAFIASVHAEKARLAALYAAGVTRDVQPVADPCTVNHRSMPSITALVDANGSLPEIAGYAEFCETLRANGFGLMLTGVNIPVEDRSHSWVAVGLYDLATGARGNLQTFGLAAIHQPVPEGDPEGLWTALSGGLDGTAAQTSEFVASVEEELAAHAAFFAAGQ